MQFKTLATLLAMTGAAVAQDLTDVPHCATAPALQVFGKTGCQIGDLTCICNSSKFIPELVSAVAAACSASDLQKADQFAIDTCKSIGINISIPGFSDSSSGSAASSAASTSGPSATSGSPMSTTSGMMSIMTDSSSSKTSAPASAASDASMTLASSSSASPSPSTGAGNTVKIAGSALAGVFFAALAL